jgi:hypothetical protein
LCFRPIDCCSSLKRKKWFCSSFFLAPNNPTPIYRALHDAWTSIEENREEKENLCSISIDNFPILVFFLSISFSQFWCPSKWQTRTNSLLFSFIFFSQLENLIMFMTETSLALVLSYPADTSTNTWSDLPMSSSSSSG